MNDWRNYEIPNFPFENPEKYCDLVVFDRPLVSHFIADNGLVNLIYYWVDFDDSYDRFLIFRISLKELYNYVLGRINLIELFDLNSPKFIVAIDQNISDNSTKSYLIDLSVLPEDYLPEEDAYLANDRLPDIYNDFFEKEKETLYLQSLKKDSLTLKIESKTRKYESTVGISPAVEFLTNIKNSYGSYAKANFFDFNKDLTADATRLNKTFNKLKPILDLRIVELKAASLEISLSLDKVYTPDDPKLKSWHWDLFDQFRNEVIELDYRSEDEIEKIVSKFSEFDRRKIYNPIIKITNSKNYNLSVIDKGTHEKRKLDPIKKQIEEKLIPDTFHEISIEKEVLKLAVLKVAAGKEIYQLKQSELKEGLLFSEITDDFIIKITDKIENDNYIAILKKTIHCEFHQESDASTLINSQFNIEITESDPKRAIQSFNDAFLEICKQVYAAGDETAHPYASLINEFVEELKEKLS